MSAQKEFSISYSTFYYTNVSLCMCDVYSIYFKKWEVTLGQESLYRFTLDKRWSCLLLAVVQNVFIFNFVIYNMRHKSKQFSGIIENDVSVFLDFWQINSFCSLSTNFTIKLLKLQANRSCELYFDGPHKQKVKHTRKYLKGCKMLTTSDVPVECFSFIFHLFSVDICRTTNCVCVNLDCQMK